VNTTKLSKLQKGILKAALSIYWHRAYDGKEGFLSSEAIGKIFFDIPRLSLFRDKYRQPPAEYRQKRRIHNRIDTSISRALTKLQARGLVHKVKDGFCTGCRLTSYGLEVARRLVPQNLTGPNKQEEKKMKARGIQARTAKEQHLQSRLQRLQRS